MSSSVTHPPEIHPSAVVSLARKSDAIVISDLISIVGEDVVLDDRVRLQAHVVIEGRTFIGKDTVVFPFRVDRSCTAGLEI